MTQRKRGTAHGLARIALAGGLAALLAGCGLSSVTSGIGGGVLGGSGGGSGQVKSVTEEQLLTAAKADEPATGSTSVGEIAHGCPRFAIWPRDHHLTVYEAGRVGDGLAVAHRGEITKTARECQIQENRVTVKYGFSGRVLLGPRGKAGRVTLPLNVFVTDSKREKIAADQLKVEVSVELEKPIGYFSAVRSVTFTIPEGSRPGEFEVFVGFDRNVPNAG
jgi:hypothetical protein